MDIKKTEEKLNQVDSLLDTLVRVLKKHWLILLCIAIAVGIYLFVELQDGSDQPEINSTEQTITE